MLQFGELYTALQNGVIDGQENPLDIIQSMKFFEVQKNVAGDRSRRDHRGDPDESGMVQQACRKTTETIVKAAFAEVAPQVEGEKAADAESRSRFFKQRGLNVRIADEAERAEAARGDLSGGRDAYISTGGRRRQGDDRALREGARDAVEVTAPLAVRA